MSPAVRRRIGLALLILAILAAVWPAARQAWLQRRNERAVYAASGRTAALPEIRLPDGTVDVNTADLYELTELHGVGESLAQAILDEREAHGPFRYPEDLLAVRGIGAKKLAGFRDTLDLSTAEEETEP